MGALASCKFPFLDESFIPVLKGLYINLSKVEKVKEHRCIFSCGKEVLLSDRSYSKLRIHHNAFYRMRQLQSIKQIIETQ